MCSGTGPPLLPLGSAKLFTRGYPISSNGLRPYGWVVRTPYGGFSTTPPTYAPKGTDSSHFSLIAFFQVYVAKLFNS